MALFLQESSSPDSCKGNYLSVLRVSSTAGGEINQPLSEIDQRRNLWTRLPTLCRIA